MLPTCVFPILFFPAYMFVLNRFHRRFGSNFTSNHTVPSDGLGSTIDVPFGCVRFVFASATFEVCLWLSRACHVSWHAIPISLDMPWRERQGSHLVSVFFQGGRVWPTGNKPLCRMRMFLPTGKIPSVCVFLIFIECESCTWPISTTPTSKHAD